MSEIRTFSKFFYGFQVTEANRSIDFSESIGVELQANIAIGSYTLTEYLVAVKNALEDVGALTYVVSVDRSTRVVTISADGPFDLLCQTGSRQGTSAWALLGFSTTSDRTGLSAYSGDLQTGFEYRPQAILYDYVSAEDAPVKENAVKITSARGVVQTTFFGDGARVEFNIKYATDIALDNICGPGDIEAQVNGIANLRAFMRALINQERIEFMPDRDTPDNFVKMILERSAGANRNGTSFKLTRSDFVGYVQTGDLVFRTVD